MDEITMSLSIEFLGPKKSESTYAENAVRGSGTSADSTYAENADKASGTSALLVPFKQAGVL